MKSKIEIKVKEIRSSTYMPGGRVSLLPLNYSKYDLSENNLE